ncbi:unnamed protein product [Paramecium pentaurelia]|uniref:Uncharacterized protein n=1 Tax=Paramecium pentaurelia TaxID=43138 RepID=A0A8S1XZQ1_9CILI|nr:unnamed protein product [Paramecium pentaurelia]
MLNSSFNFFEENDISKLRKYIISKENEWKKDKAVLEQKTQLLELQLEDYKLRETNQRKLNDTINQAISDSTANQKKSYAELQKNIDIQQKDQSKTKFKELIKQLEYQVRQLQEQLQEKESQGKEMELQYQKQYMLYDHRISQLEQEKLVNCQDNQRLRENLIKQEDFYKQKEQQQKMIYDQELQKAKDQCIQDNNTKQQDYESKFAQLSTLHEKEKEQLQLRINKCQNTIKKYQQHLEQNIDVVNLKQQYEDQIKQLNNQNIEIQAQFQYEKQILQKQIEDMKKINRDSNLIENMNFHNSTSKKRSIDAIKIKSSLQSYDSPIQCKSFHIACPESKIEIYNNYLKNSSTQSIILAQKQQIQSQLFQNNQSFDKSSNMNEGMPISIDQFNLMKDKKQKSQSTFSIPTSNNYNLNSYLQEQSIFQQNQESFQLDSKNNLKEETQKSKILKQLNPNISNRQIQFDYNRSIKHELQKQKESNYQRSMSQEGVKQQICNLNKMLGQTEISYQQSTSTQQITNNTSLNSFKVPAFTQNQLNTLKNSSQYMCPCTTLRMKENIQKIRYNHNHSTHEETKQNKENYQPKKNNQKSDIKLIIGRLLQNKGKQSDQLENTGYIIKNNRI